MAKAGIFFRRATRMLVILLVVGVIVNDGTRLLGTFKTASGGMNDAMNAAADAVRANPNAPAQDVAAQAALARGATLESYDQKVANNSSSVQVRVSLAASAPLTRTYVLAPIVGMLTNVPASAWYDPAGVKITLRTSKLVTQLGLAP